MQRICSLNAKLKGEVRTDDRLAATDSDMTGRTARLSATAAALDIARGQKYPR